MPVGFEVQQVRRVKVYHDIINQIKELIAQRRINAGDRLPPERELAQLFHASRNSVRDALRVLEQMGLIESRQGDGTYVRTPRPEELTEPLALLLMQSRAHMHELWEMRRVIEPAVVEFAAQRITRDELEELETILAAQEKKVLRGLPGLEEDTAFHYAIAEAARNGVLMKVIDTVMDLLKESREKSLQQGDRPTYSLEGHRRVLEALRRADPTGARAEMLGHLREVEESILSATERERD